VDLPSTSEEMTLPRVERDKLIFVASLNLMPRAPVFDCRSEPLKTTHFYLILMKHQKQ